jgi:hypothetical protein
MDRILALTKIIKLFKYKHSSFFCPTILQGMAYDIFTWRRGRTRRCKDRLQVLSKKKLSTDQHSSFFCPTILQGLAYDIFT